MNCTKLSQALLALSLIYAGTTSLHADILVNPASVEDITQKLKATKITPDATKKADKKKAKTKKKSVGIKIKHNNVMLLNTSLVDYPEVILRIQLSAKSVGQVKKTATDQKSAFAKKSTKDQAEFITRQLNKILAPVEQFFDSIQEYSGMILPILEESLKSHKIEKDAILIKYFSSKTHIKDFCHKEIVTIDALEKFCTELSYFFADLNATFDINVKKAFKVFMTEFKSKRKKN